MQSESGNDYWSLDHALAQEERISSTFLSGAISFGYLDSGVVGTDLKPGDRAIVPLWLATWLADRNMVEMTLPSYFQQNQRLRLLSDPREADLNSSSPYLYEVGHELLPRVGPSAAVPVPAIKQTLLALFIVRFLDVVSTSQNSRPDQDVSVFTRKLTTYERELFQKGLAHSREMYSWKPVFSDFNFCRGIDDSVFFGRLVFYSWCTIDVYFLAQLSFSISLYLASDALGPILPGWAIRFVTQLGVYVFLSIVAYGCVHVIRQTAPNDDSLYGRVARFLVLGYDPVSRPTNELGSANEGETEPAIPKSEKSAAIIEGDGPTTLKGADPVSKSIRALLLAYCTLGLLTSYLVWGVLQERIMSTEYSNGGRFESSNFLVFSNRMFALAVAIPIMWWKGEGTGRAPFYKYAFTSFSNTLSSWCQLESLKFLSFPIQVLGKSSKLVPVMIMGRILSRKRYPWYEYGIAFFIMLGVSLFFTSQKGDKGGDQGSSEVSGLILMAGYLAFDSFTSQWQDVLFKQYGLSPYQMMFGINAFSSIFTLASLLQSGELFESMSFVTNNPEAAWHICIFSLAGAVGQTFIFHTIKEFGPVVFTIITTTRQLVAVELSVILFGHHIEPLGNFGAFLAFGAIGFRIWKKEQESQLAMAKAKLAKDSEILHMGDEEKGSLMSENTPQNEKEVIIHSDSSKVTPA